jgi:scyllo-inositol 2-dehydrogenase (NADP+)
MLNVGLVGVGKMGLSHLSILNAHPDIQSVRICESSGYVRSALEKYSGMAVTDSYGKLLDEPGLDAVVIATPSKLHARMVRQALDKGLHVFCEKPFCLDPSDSRELAELAARKRLVNQVGYHYRFVGTFNEAKRLIGARALGDVHHIRVEAYGPVVLRPKGVTWRNRSDEGGGCLYDYACHALDLVNYLVGPPQAVGGAALNRVFSADVDDEVYATLYFGGGLNGQIAANWSDESFRRMSTAVGVWGTNGRIVVDRQEIRTFVRNPRLSAVPIAAGWRTRNITELTAPVNFYLRGEEYSAQIDHFVNQIKRGEPDATSTFATAAQTDEVVSMIRRAAENLETASETGVLAGPGKRKAANFWGRAGALMH